MSWAALMVVEFSVDIGVYVGDSGAGQLEPMWVDIDVHGGEEVLDCGNNNQNVC